MPTRQYLASGLYKYRFSFNGKEKDDEMKGSAGNSYDFGARIYDSRLGRWLSIDPLTAKYPNLSPYNFANDNPVLFVDYDGEDFGIKIDLRQLAMGLELAAFELLCGAPSKCGTQVWPLGFVEISKFLRLPPDF